MESYQSIGIVMAVVGSLLAIGLNFTTVNGFVIVFIVLSSFIGLIVALINPKHHKAAGITMIVVGLFGNFLLIIPGIMAIRYKPKFVLTK